MNTVKLKYHGEAIPNIASGSTVYEVSKTVQKDFKYPIIGAKLNNLYIDLSEEITENGTIDFFDLSSAEGNNIYQRSLEFLTIVAAKEVLEKDSEVLINYSLNNGIYCEVVGQKLQTKTVENIEEKMHELVKQELPIIKAKVARLEAIKYFKKTKQLDKVKNLNYTSNSTIGLHKLKNTYDYFFGTLAHNTGQINKFKLTYIRNNFFVVNYPSIEKPNVVASYKEYTSLVKMYDEFKEWGQTINISLASDLNDWGAKGKYGDAIRIFEAHFESVLSFIAEDIYKKKDRIKVILLSGPSSSGKTTTSKKLALYLKAKGITTRQISLDDYLVTRKKTPKDENGEYDFDDIGATDVKLFNNHLEKLLSGKKVDIPEHNFESGTNIYDGKYVSLEENEILLVEGTHALNDILTKNIKRENKYKIFISPLAWLKIDNHNRIRTTDIRKLRRIVRDNRTRSTTAEETLKMWPNVDRGTSKNIYPFQYDVDAVINSSLSYELGVLRIYAEPLLYGISQTSEVYSEAIRLINVLRQFLPISSEEVPKDSILREFIGDGIYNQ